MAFTAVPTGNWQKAYVGSAVGAGAACSLVDASNYVGSIGTIGKSDDWRVDRQMPPANKTNLQIQRNGVGNPSTIACCLVPNHYATKLGNLHDEGVSGAKARFAELTKAIHNGLSSSVGSRRASVNGMEVQAFEITGNFSG